MNDNLFRKSTIDRVNSPEQLNEYIRVAKPSVWIILAAVILLLAGVLIWGIFGNIETTVEADVSVEKGETFCFVLPEQAEKIEEGMEVRIGEDSTGTVASVSKEQYLVEGPFEVGAYCSKVQFQAADLPDGTYPGEIIIESIRPIYFILH